MVMDWLYKLTGRPPELTAPKPQPRREFDLLLSAERDSILTSHLNAPLAELGLIQIAPRHWVDGSVPPARRMFQMSLLKGAGIVANWGFSLDFVPHISGRALRWHRSDRTAKLDVIIDPKRACQTSFIHGAKWLHHDLKELMPDAIAQATETWRQGQTFEGMLAILREVRERKTNRFGFNNYTQMPLAQMFLLAKTGDLSGALAELDAYRPFLKPPHDAAVKEKLAKLLRSCAEA